MNSKGEYNRSRVARLSLGEKIIETFFGRRQGRCRERYGGLGRREERGDLEEKSDRVENKESVEEDDI